MKEINLNIIEPLVRSGVVRISPFKNSLICATFFSLTNTPVSVNSDRGIEHLFACLYERVVGDVVMDGEALVTKRADEKYRYPVSLGCSSNVQRMLERSFTELSYSLEESDESRKFTVYSEQYETPSLDSVAGKYAKIGKGSNLESAFTMAVSAEPMLL